jgi:hypothetical protein
MQLRQPHDIEAGALGLIDLLERLGESFGFGLSWPALKFVEHAEFHGHISLLWPEK